MKPLGLYIHIPWCIKKCPYCDFNSHAVKSETPEQHYIESLIQDLQQDLNLLDEPRTISSIFIGGGTPSLFSASSFDYLLNAIDRLIPFEEGLEITLEANPSTFESQKFSDYRTIGINRLSIGIQSFNNRHLTKLGRIHSAEESLAAVDIAHQAGFNNINLDLMFGLPDQSNQEMLDDVQTAIDLNPNHISFYQLTLEPNTYFYNFPPTLPKDDFIFIGQTECQALLKESGYQQYEISAYAKEGKRCQHNINYWTFGDYLGIGAGAHGKLSLSCPTNITRSLKQKKPEQYMSNTLASLTTIAPNELPLEFLINQLRLKAGFNLSHYQAATGLDPSTLEPALSNCIHQRLLTQQDNTYFCTEKGWNFIDNILEKFIS